MQYHKIELNELPICEHCEYFEIISQKDCVYADTWKKTYTSYSCEHYKACERAMKKGEK